jgi:uncharacterized membrane protein
MALRVAIFLAIVLCGGAVCAQPQESALGHLQKDVHGLSKASEAQKRRAALREATTASKTAPGPSAPVQKLSPQERAELRQQLRHQRYEAQPKNS